MTGTILLPGSPLVPCNTVIGIRNFDGYPKPPLPVEGIWSEYKTATRSVSYVELLTLLLGNWFWYNTAARPGLGTILLPDRSTSTGLTQN